VHIYKILGSALDKQVMKNFWQITFLIMFLAFSVSVFGQNIQIIDSLKRELLKQQTDTGKIMLLISISHQFATSDTVSALSYIEQAKKLAKLVDCEKCNAYILLMEGSLFRSTSNHSEALEKLEKALSIYRKLDIKIQIAKCCLWIGSTYKELSQHTKALIYFSEAMELFKLLDYKPGISQCYFLMAIVYSAQGKHKIAIDFSKKSLQLADKKNKKVIAELYYNMFCSYMAEKEYQKALSLEDSIFPVFKEISSFYLLGRAYAGLGMLHSDMGNYKKAKESIKQSIYYCSKFKNLENLFLAKLCLAKIYVKTNQLDSAIITLKNLLDINNKQLKSIEHANSIYYDLFRIYEKKGDLKLALEYCNLYLPVNDSITKDLNDKKLLEIQTQYEVDLKNEQILLLLKEKQLARQKYFIIVISLLLILISGLYAISYKQKKAKEKQLLLEAELKDAKNKIETKQRELTLKAMHISQQGHILSNVKDQLENVKKENPGSKVTIQSLLSNINQQLNQNAFKDFEKYFIEVHPKFYDTLKLIYPTLTQNELRVCALLRLNLNSKQIADITGKTNRSVENTRTLIRRKMGLTLQDNLFEKISTI
jgi:tetratricopeptide (TPR) repeat protein